MSKENLVPVDPDRQRIEAEIARHLNSSLSESMSSRQVDIFQNHQFEAQRLQSILVLSDQTSLPIALVEKLDQVNHNVMNRLVLDGKIDEARQVVLNPQLARQQNALAFENAERFVQSQSRLGGFRKTG